MRVRLVKSLKSNLKMKFMNRA